MKYTNIVFDIDGTLLDTEYAVLHSLQDTVREAAGTEMPLSELTFALGITGADALERLHITDIPNTLDRWNENMGKYADTVTVFDGMRDVLENLRKAGCEMGIVTSRTREEYGHDFRSLSIGHYFKTIICADDTRKHKPDGEPLLKYMELSGAGHGNILYVGDSEYDSRCAGNAGVCFALAVWGSHREDIRAEYYLREPAGLLSAITDAFRGAE